MSGLRRKAASGAKWVGASTVFKILAGYGVLLAVAPRISATEFGLFSTVMIVVNFGQIFADNGLRDGLIYRQTPTRDELSTVFWLSCGVALIVLLAVIGTAPVLAALLDAPRLKTLLLFASPVAAALALGAPFQGRLEGELRFRALAGIEIWSSVVLFGVTIAALPMLGGLGALVAGLVANAFVRLMLLLVVGWETVQPRLVVDIAGSREVIRFGAFRLGDGLLSFFAQRADQIAIAVFLGQEALGIYVFAWRLVIEPAQRANPIFTRVLFPGLAKIRDDLDRVARAYLLGLKLITTFNVPLVMGIATTGSVLVPLFFGAQWLLTVPLMRILVMVALLRILINPMGALLLSQGRSDLSFCWNVAVAVCMSLVTAAAAAWADLSTLAASLAALYAVFFVGHHRVFVRTLVPTLTFGDLVRAVRAPIVFSFVAMVPAVLVERWLDAPAPAVLVSQVAVAVATYLAIFWFSDRSFVLDTLKLLVNRPETRVKPVGAGPR